ncbi:LamG domain-containing protein [Desulfovibrio aminophilus]|uniref:LamG domain-containing protein n=1 Tax=Desulfovibrio aminophilus TaxID=81425 RepID=UPI000427A75E|nr:LamG-like jellyroll fold domain-containing protein [Desulfovibrio aminophilus]
MRQTQRGALLLYVIAAVVVFSVLAGTMAAHFSLSTRASAHYDCQKAARLMAESGIRYATSNLRAATNSADLTARVNALNGQTFWMADGSSFALTAVAGGQGYIVTSTGSSPCAGDATITAGLTRDFAVAVGGEGIISFADGDLSGFEAVPGSEGTETVKIINDTSNPANSSVELGGGTIKDNFGALWYGGGKGDCVNGNCTLGNGVRAYFEFQFNSGSDGDGFIFSLISAETNTRSVGGDTSMGELMGYGGTGWDGKGLVPPKIGLEFDIYPNECSSTLCSPGSRCDSTYDHIAFVLWGDEAGVSGTCSDKKSKRRYDDNRHGAGTLGSTSVPKNAKSGETGFYTRSSNNWMQNGGSFRLRYELTRQTTPASDGNYCYELRAWLQSTSLTMPAGMDDVTKDYAPAPDIQQVFYLSPALHAQFDHFYFGWTEGTGAAMQLATLRKFALDFKPALPAQSIPRSSNLRAHWSMRAVSGSTVQDIVGSRSGTAYGSYDWVPGTGCPDCSALRLYGSNSDYVQVSDTGGSSLDLTSAGTIAAWIYIPDASSLNSYAGLVHKGASGDFSDEVYSLQLWPTRRLTLAVITSAGTSYQVISADSIPAQGWHHVAGTWGSGGMRVFIDGVMNGQDGASPTARTNNASLQVGAQIVPSWRYSNSYPFNGIIDEVMLYNVELNAAEIETLYKNSPWGQGE